MLHGCSAVTDLANAWDLADGQGVHKAADGAVLTRNCILPVRLPHVSGHLHQASHSTSTGTFTATTVAMQLIWRAARVTRGNGHLGQEAIGADAAGTCQPSLFADPPPNLICYCFACAGTEPPQVPVSSQQLNRQQARDTPW